MSKIQVTLDASKLRNLVAKRSYENNEDYALQQFEDENRTKELSPDVVPQDLVSNVDFN